MLSAFISVLRSQQHGLPVFSIISLSLTKVFSLISLFSNSFKRSSKLSTGCVDAIDITEMADNDVLSCFFSLEFGATISVLSLKIKK